MDSNQRLPVTDSKYSTYGPIGCGLDAKPGVALEFPAPVPQAQVRVQGNAARQWWRPLRTETLVTGTIGWGAQSYVNAGFARRCRCGETRHIFGRLPE